MLRHPNPLQATPQELAARHIAMHGHPGGAPQPQPGGGLSMGPGPQQMAPPPPHPMMPPPQPHGGIPPGLEQRIRAEVISELHRKGMLQRPGGIQPTPPAKKESKPDPQGVIPGRPNPGFAQTQPNGGRGGRTQPTDRTAAQRKEK